MKHHVPIWICAISLLSIAVSFLYLIVLNQAALNDTRVFLALVAAITAVVTTLGSFYLAGFNARKKEEQDRATESRKLKIDYYFRFLEALTRKMSHPKDDDLNMTFCVEKNRLPLYASQEVIELVEKIAKGVQSNTPTFTDLYAAIRNDLTTSAFSDLCKLTTDISFHLAKSPDQ